MKMVIIRIMIEVIKMALTEKRLLTQPPGIEKKIAIPIKLKITPSCALFMLSKCISGS